MVFSSLLFIFGFLPVFLGVYWLSPSKLKNGVAFCFSCLFYAWGAPQVLPILLLSSLLDYLCSHRIYRSKIYLVVPVVFNIATLAYFKYSNFFLKEFCFFFGYDCSSFIEIALPIGISFFTFQKISYLIDVYRKEVPPADSFLNYALFVALFPQLIAGPIIRYHEIADQLKKRSLLLLDIQVGFVRFAEGLAKKVLLANPMGAVADRVFALPSDEITAAYAYVGICCYAFQIFFDFSGYSDMAIGLGRMMGFRFPENFRNPYISKSITEFWSRWHITLSAWMKEYLYIPLGGNRRGKLRTYANLWTVFLLSGLWHGANWTFLLWGAYHGFFLAIEKSGLIQFRAPALLRVVITFVIVIFGWVLFRSESLDGALDYFSVMLFLTDAEPSLQWSELIASRERLVLFVCALLSFAPALKEIDISRPSLARAYATLALFLLATVSLTNSSFNPFIYFRF